MKKIDACCISVNSESVNIQRLWNFCNTTQLNRSMWMFNGFNSSKKILDEHFDIQIGKYIYKWNKQFFICTFHVSNNFFDLRSQIYSNIFLPPICKINYIKLHENFVNMQDDNVLCKIIMLTCKLTWPSRMVTYIHTFCMLT